MREECTVFKKGIKMLTASPYKQRWFSWLSLSLALNEHVDILASAFNVYTRVLDVMFIVKVEGA
jgi:hypothetical protein